MLHAELKPLANSYHVILGKEYKFAIEKEQARRKTFDSMDLKGTGVITVDEWLKFCVEHIIAKAATLTTHPILVQRNVEEFKAFVNAALVIGSPEHTEMYWFLFELFTKSAPDKDDIVMMTDFFAMTDKALESSKDCESSPPPASLQPTREPLQQHKLLKVIKETFVRQVLDMIKKFSDYEY